MAARRDRITEDFYLDEFVGPGVYALLGGRARGLLDERIVKMAQWLRNKSGCAVTINNWWDGGQYRESGYREPGTKTGAKYSQHKMGRAIDVKVAGMTPKMVHELILGHQSDLVAAGMCTVLEDVAFTTTWTHIDNRWTGMNKIVVVKP